MSLWWLESITYRISGRPFEEKYIVLTIKTVIDLLQKCFGNVELTRTETTANAAELTTLATALFPVTTLFCSERSMYCSTFSWKEYIENFTEYFELYMKLVYSIVLYNSVPFMAI